MPISRENKTYTAADIKRYHDGAMSPAEMHALESAALEDPFLSDALDGYAYTDDQARDLRGLAEAIRPKEKEAKKTILFNTVWFRVAAMLILIAGAAYIGFQKGMTKERNTGIAKNTAPVVLPQTTRPATILADTSDNLASNTQQDKLIKKNKAPGVKADTNLTGIPNDVAVNFTQDESSVRFDKATAPIIMEKQNDDIAKDADKTKAQAKHPFVLRGKVLDNTGSPIPFANISSNKGDLHFNTDIEGSFSLPVKDSVFMANVSALGYASVNTAMNSNSRQNIIIVPKQEGQLSEAVVTGYDRRRKAANASISKISKKDIAAPKTETTANEQADKYSIPIKGRQFYDRYLIDSLRRPAIADAESIKGTVVLSFIVTRNGNPEKIKIVQSLCKSCDEEAIRLLKAGPKWSYTNKKRATLSVQF